jgi:hypothetical protein
LSCYISLQDITSFDFHESLATLSNTQQHENDISPDPDSSSQNVSSSGAMSSHLKPYSVTSFANEVEIEVDPLNDHECMAHLIRLLEFMRDEKIYDSTNVQKLPGS